MVVDHALLHRQGNVEILLYLDEHYQYLFDGMAFYQPPFTVDLVFVA